MNQDVEFYHSNRYRCLFSRLKQTEDLFLTSAGSERCVPGNIFHTQKRSGYHLHIILSGKGSLRVDGETQILHSGQMFITKPREDAWYGPDKDNPWTYCWMSFDGNNARGYAESMGFKSGVNWLDCRLEQGRFYSLVQKVLNAPELTLANELDHLGLLLQYISLAIESGYREQSLPREREYEPNAYVQYALDYMRTNFATAKIEEIARNIGIHRSYLTSIFKKETGMPPQKFLIQCKMKESARLLTETNMAVQEISEIVGYDDVMAFSKAFKGAYKVSPRNYRQEQRQGMSKKASLPEFMSDDTNDRE